MRGLSTEGNLRFKLDRASLIVGSKFTIFSLFYVVFEGNFPSTSPWGAYIWRGNLTEGFLRYQFWGLLFGGAYTWGGLFSEFYGIYVPMHLKLTYIDKFMCNLLYIASILFMGVKILQTSSLELYAH